MRPSLQSLPGCCSSALPELKRRLANDDRNFVYLHRQVDVEIAERIAALKIAGVHRSREFKRHYPEGPTSAHVIGFTNVEDRGQEGIELAYERQLAGRAGSRRVIKDRLGRVVEDDWLREPVDGRDIALSIDNRVQYIAFSALRAAVEKHQARAGAVVMHRRANAANCSPSQTGRATTRTRAADSRAMQYATGSSPIPSSLVRR